MAHTSLVTDLQLLATWFEQVMYHDDHAFTIEGVQEFSRLMRGALAKAERLETTAVELAGSLDHYGAVMAGVHRTMARADADLADGADADADDVGAQRSASEDARERAGAAPLHTGNVIMFTRRNARRPRRPTNGGGSAA